MLYNTPGKFESPAFMIMKSLVSSKSLTLLCSQTLKGPHTKHTLVEIGDKFVAYRLRMKRKRKSDLALSSS